MKSVLFDINVFLNRESWVGDSAAVFQALTRDPAGFQNAQIEILSPAELLQQIST